MDRAFQCIGMFLEGMRKLENLEEACEHSENMQSAAHLGADIEVCYRKVAETFPCKEI